MKKTKIICTLGPSANTEPVLRELILAGMDVARFNFSHGDHEMHRNNLTILENLRDELHLPVASLLDTKGPEIRICNFKDGPVMLEKGQTFTLTTREVEGDGTIVSVTYKDLIDDIQEGTYILIDDGLIAMTVESMTATDIVCRVLNNGMVSNHKGVNVPNVELSMPYISEKDRADIIFGVKNGYDFIAASFVRCAADVLEIRKIFEEFSCSNTMIISKIENRQGVDNIDEIIAVSDGVMIARGDMGVEIPLEEVPVLQKLLIKKVQNAGKPVITATQMLESMIKNPRPTRAEATDVANAIYDGTSAIMLSGETAAGAYPVEALETMVRIAQSAEADIDYAKRLKNRDVPLNPDVTNAISHATCSTAHDLGAAAVITVTKSGKTARMISKYKPVCPIIGCSTDPKVCRQMNLSWGIAPILVDEKKSTDDLFEHAVDRSEQMGMVKNGELVVITAGVPLGISGTTNMMKVHVVGHILISGTGITKNIANANLCVCRDEAEALKAFKPGDILVVPTTSNTLLPILKKASGIITEAGGTNSHAAIVGLSLDIPVIIHAENATKILRSGAFVTIDAARGYVCCN